MGLGFKSEQLEAPVNSFSGGWRMRLQLARALMCPSRLAVARRAHQPLGLGRFGLARSLAQAATRARMLVISHDREFLDAVTRRHLAHRKSQTQRATAAATARFEDHARRTNGLATNRRVDPSQQEQAWRTCKNSSTASRPRPAKPSKRKAASRRSSADGKNRHRCSRPKPTSPSNSREPAKPAQPHAGLASDVDYPATPARKADGSDPPPSCATSTRSMLGGPAHRHLGRQRPG